MKTMYFTGRLRRPAFAVAVVIALQSLLIGMNAQQATAELNISSEDRELTRFSDDLFNFSEQVLNLRKKSRVTDAELASIRSSANGIKQKIAAAQQNFRSILTKLKAANQLDTLDARVNGPISAGSRPSILQRASGTKKLLEDLASNLGPLAQEIDQELQRSTAFTATAPPNVAGTRRCTVAIAVARVKMFITGRFLNESEFARLNRICGVDTSGTPVQ